MTRPITVLAALSLLCAAPSLSLAGGVHYSWSSKSSAYNHNKGNKTNKSWTNGYHKPDCFDKTKDHHNGRDCKPKNKPPKAVDDCTVNVDVNKSVTIDVLRNDYDMDGNKLTITGVSKPSHGTAVIKSGKIVYTPAKNYTGDDSFTYTISDGKGGSDSGRVCIKVKGTTPPPNKPPKAQDDCTINVTVNKAVTIDVLANDTDPDGNKLTIAAVSKPRHGTAVILNGKIVYTPSKDYTGDDDFNYTVSDGKGGYDTAKVCLKIKGTPPPPNNPPKAQDDCTIDVAADTPIVINVLANDLPTGSTFTITDFTQPQHGTVIRNGDDTFTYTPNTGYRGPDTFTYTISNGAVCSTTGGSSDPYTLTSTLLANGDVMVVLRQSRNVVDNTYGVNSSPGYPRRGEHWFKDLVNSDHARFVLTNGAGQTVMDFYVDYLSASNAYPSGYGTLGVTGGDGSIRIGNPANIVSVTTTMTTNLNQSPSFYGYTVDSPAPEANFPTWDYVDGYTLVISKNAFGPSGFGSVTSPDVHNSPAKKGGTTTPTPVPCTSTAKVCLNVKGTPPPPPPACAGLLIFGPDVNLTDNVKNYIVSRGYPASDVDVYRTSIFNYEPDAFTNAVNLFKAKHGAPPCAVMLDPEYVGPDGNMYSGLNANDQQTLKNLILSGTGFVYAEPYTEIYPQGQVPDVLPVFGEFTKRTDLLYEVLDLNFPVTSNLPGLTLNPLTGRYGWNPDSAGQNISLQVTSLTPGAVPGVRLTNINPILVTFASGADGSPITTSPVNSFTLNYEPIGGPTAAQPGARVVVLGTDTYYTYGGSPPPATTFALYYNALLWAANQ